MVALTPPPPTLAAGNLTLFYVVDDLLARSPILVFYGPSATATANANSSRIQAHVFSPAGLQSSPRLTISPSSPLYSAITCLPREEQSDEVVRGLAFSLYKYFTELPEAVRDVWTQQPTPLGKQPHAPQLLSDAHAAILASRMQRVENVADVVSDMQNALAEQSVSWLDVDLVLPPGAIKKIEARDSLDQDGDDYAFKRFGGYASIVKLFGEPTFLPTSKLRRAPSKPTGLNRHTTFSRQQKEGLRREIIELLDTEENYVSKLDDLLHSVAEEFREKARGKSMDSQSPSAQALEKLFPPSLDEILKVNGQFLDALRAVVEETENSAIKDIEATSPEAASAPNVVGDATGAVRVAECLLEWLPKFSACYADYLQAHSQFSQFLRVFLNDSGSSFSKRVQDTGEQRLMSMLIEPVQRLPRYSLYVDNIVKQLPARHAAIKLFLKARDQVSEICTREVAPMSPGGMLEILARVASLWPSSLVPSGRLITAVDAVLLDPPYHANNSKAVHSIILLFTDMVFILQKNSKQATSARMLLSYLDGTGVLPSMEGEADLEYRQYMRLCDVEFSELMDGAMVQLLHLPSDTRQRITELRRPGSKSLQKSIQVFRLLGMYDGKAAKLGEEFAKARTEGRFSEAERESYAWEVRSTGASRDLQLLTAVFEDHASIINEGRGPHAKIRIVVDPLRGTRQVKPGEDGVDILVNLTIQGESFFKMEVSSLLLNTSKDHVTSQEFLAVFGKRLNNFLQPACAVQNPKVAPVLLARNQFLLQSLPVRLESAAAEDSTFLKETARSPSPVKMLSSLFSGSSSPTKHVRGAFSVNDAPRLLPTSFSAPSVAGPAETQGASPSRPVSYLEVNLPGEETSGDANLEQTLNTYIIALHARKGNVVGRVLQARAHSADPSAVNELYNTLLEDGSAWQTAAQAPVDVLFAAFEKFVKMTWNAQVGDILSARALATFHANGQVNLDSSCAESKAALKEVIKLLADLLDGTKSDGDRGILTAAFADTLAPEGTAGPQDVIPLLDRIIADQHGIFNGATDDSTLDTPSRASVHSRSESVGAISGPFSSHHSSLRKKFGFGTLHRKNSKLESDKDSEGTSVWRTLSKGRSGTNSNTLENLMPAPLLARSKSQDERDNPFMSQKRPVSRDRPMAMNAFGDATGLGTIGESIGEGLASGPPRKKRRSSLSDLLEMKNSPTPNRLELQLPQSPRIVSPTRPNVMPTGIPQRRTSVRAGNGSPRKENATPYANSTLPRLTSPLSPSSSATTISRGSPNRPAGPRQNLNDAFAKPTPRSLEKDEVVITAHATSPSKRRTGSVNVAGSGIPSLRPTPGALSDRPNAANIARYPPSSPEKTSGTTQAAGGTSPIRKLRMQSPQKLRERLAMESQAIKDADAALADEMAKIGEELNSLPPGGGAPFSRPGTASSSGSLQHSQLSVLSAAQDNTKVKALETRLKGLEAAIPTTISSLSKRLTTLEADVSSSLAVSEQKARGLDELLREATAENEALYARFNEELAKIMRGVRDGTREQAVLEMRKQMAGMKEEQERLRKENARLRREAVGLRAQLRE